jgi:murein DD-endopeptidase MepM/ murein hydrolase activator NlpD
MSQQLELDLRLNYSAKWLLVFCSLIALPLLVLSLIPDEAEGSLQPKTSQQHQLEMIVDSLPQHTLSLDTQPQIGPSAATPLSQEVSESLSEPTPESPQDSLPALDSLLWTELTVKRGDTLAKLLAKTSLSPSEIHQLAYGTTHGKELVKLKPDEVIKLGQWHDEIKEIHYSRDPMNRYVFIQEQGRFISENHLESHHKTELTARFTIQNSLFVDGAKAGLSDRMLYKLMQIFAYDIDFALDLRQGDEFRVIYEGAVFENGHIEPGQILAAEYHNPRKNIKALAFTQNKQTHYYTPEGKSLRKGFIRTPVKVGYISSRFNPNRRHPVLNTIRAHKGTDYAAPVGTPIYATGDGKLVFKGWQNGYGNTLVIAHPNGISTLYAHISKFEAKLAVNQRIKQGQLIAYVGQTGLASGPHLHYEFKVNGQHKDPEKVKLPSAPSLSGAQLAQFKHQSLSRLAMLERLNPQLMAQQ